MKRNILLLFCLAIFCSTTQFAVADNNIKPKHQLLFIENKGQVNGPDGKKRNDVLFTLYGDGVKMYIQGNGIIYQFVKSNVSFDENIAPRQGKSIDVCKNEVETYQMEMKLEGANRSASVKNLKETPYYENFYNVEGHQEGISFVKSYNEFTIENVYPNIDWHLYTVGNTFKYDFIVRPGGNPNDIKLKYDGNESIKLLPNNSAEIKTPFGKIIEGKPVCYLGAKNEKVAAEYLIDDNSIKFNIATFPEDQTLIIDPSIIWSTYYGGISVEVFYSIWANDIGNLYAAGYTTSPNSISSAGHQNTIGGGGVSS